MKKILELKNPNDYAIYVNSPVLHPHICIIRYEEIGLFRQSLNRYSCYGLFIQKSFPKNISYGMKTYETEGPSIIAVAPGQIGGIEDNGNLITREGWVLLWSPELIHGTITEKMMDEYLFFSYFYNIALELNSREWEHLSVLIGLMRSEMEENEDSPALRGVLQGYLHVILEYCNRIYLKQIHSNSKKSSDLIKRFHNTLVEYYKKNMQHQRGIPSVRYCAAELSYSPRYLGDIVKKVTGSTAIAYIHSFVVEKSKSMMMQGNNISETANLLGFEYVHHFSRIFKKITGTTPSEFINR